MEVQRVDSFLECLVLLALRARGACEALDTADEGIARDGAAALAVGDHIAISASLTVSIGAAELGEVVYGGRDTRSRGAARRCVAGSGLGALDIGLGRLRLVWARRDGDGKGLAIVVVEMDGGRVGGVVGHGDYIVLGGIRVQALGVGDGGGRRRARGREIRGSVSRGGGDAARLDQERHDARWVS